MEHKCKYAFKFVSWPVDTFVISSKVAHSHHFCLVMANHLIVICKSPCAQGITMITSSANISGGDILGRGSSCKERLVQSHQ
jgi:hypothetical protein